MENSILKAIKDRRSIREFTTDTVSEKDLVTLVEAATWAPSGKNNQPWRFVILTDKKVRDHIADLTLYRHIVANCNSLIVVFLDTEAIYDEVKDHQSAGAAIQNILLAAESLLAATPAAGELKGITEWLDHRPVDVQAVLAI